MPQNFNVPVIYSLTDSNGLTSQYKVVVIKSRWNRITDNAFPTSRDGLGGLVFQNKMWTIGAWTGNIGTGKTHHSEVYSSTDGMKWDLVVEVAGWSPRHCAGYAVFQNKLWIISGDGYPDVWFSENGKEWECAVKNAPWGPRYSPYVVAFKNKLWLMGGQWYSPNNWQPKDPVWNSVAYNDVWSSDDGITWKLELENAPWEPRALIHGSVVFNDKVWIMGGGLKGTYPYQTTSETITEYNDVWSSSDCIHWEKVLSNAPWTPRTHFSTAVFDNKIFITDGSVKFQSALSNEVWYSSNGINWTQLEGSLWPKRHASCLIPFNNKLYLICGFFHNDVWVLDKEKLRK